MHRQSALSPPPSASVRWIWLAGWAVLIVAILAVYWPTLSNDLVWDDQPNLLENQHVRGLSRENIIWAFTAFHLGHYHPLTWLSLQADWMIWKNHAVGWHGMNIALHALTSVLFSICAARLLARAFRLSAGDVRIIMAGLFAAGLYALHPLRVESVAWATERRDVLCGVFATATLWCYLRASSTTDQSIFQSRWGWIALASFVLSLLAKSMSMTLPVLLVVLDVYPLRRNSAHQGQSHEQRPIPVFILEKKPFLIVSTISGIVALKAQAKAGALIELGQLSLAGRIAQACYGLIFYLRATFLNAQWFPLHERPAHLDPAESRFVLCIALTLVITAVCIGLRRGVPALLAGWVCFVLLLAPMLGTAQSGVQLVADRYTYFAGMVIAVILTGGILWFWNTLGSIAGTVGVVLAASVCAYWAVRSHQQTYVWRNEQTLWTKVLQGGPSAVAYNNLGALQDAQGQSPKALEYFTRSLDTLPTYGRARSNLAQLLIVHQEDLPQESLVHAAASLQSSLEIEGSCVDCWYALGIAHQRLGDDAAAIRDFKAALALYPSSGRLTTALAESIERAQSADAARPVFERATQIAPGSVAAWVALAEFELRHDNPAKADQALLRAQTLDPANARVQAMRQRLQGYPSHP